MRFIANMQYRIRPDQLASSSALSETSQPYALPFSHFASIRAHDYDRFDEHCDHTMVGFVQKAGASGQSSLSKHRVQCFFGVLNEKEEQTKPSA